MRTRKEDVVMLIRKCLLVAVTGITLAFLPAGIVLAGEGPDQVTLDSLASLYEAVAFDHAMHEAVADDCATCHHHTTGDTPQPQECQGCHYAGQEAATVSCRDCHLAEPFSAQVLRDKDQNVQLYHTDQVGLKAAYHLSCMGCHKEMGGPVGCEDCHARTDAGDAFFHSGSYAPPSAPANGSGH
jgi:hypothetical protein